MVPPARPSKNRAAAVRRRRALLGGRRNRDRPLRLGRNQHRPAQRLDRGAWDRPLEQHGIFLLELARSAVASPAFRSAHRQRHRDLMSLPDIAHVGEAPLGGRRAARARLDQRARILRHFGEQRGCARRNRTCRAACGGSSPAHRKSARPEIRPPSRRRHSAARARAQAQAFRRRAPHAAARRRRTRSACGRSRPRRARPRGRAPRSPCSRTPSRAPRRPRSPASGRAACRRRAISALARQLRDRARSCRPRTPPDRSCRAPHPHR